MASNIVSSTIDATFPRAGRDNNTQGFRDNFSIIKNGLATASSEITTLQNDTAKVNSDNNFNGTTLTNANAVLFTHTARNIGSVSQSQNIDLAQGHYQILRINSQADLTFTITGWPQDRVSVELAVAKLTVELWGINDLVQNTDHETTIIWTIPAGAGTGAFKKSANWPDPFVVRSQTNAESPVIVEFWSYNQGATVFANYLGKFE